ncbi:QueT transporter family protein [Gemmiger formicilis]|nr:QueT transporter family protein [Gemmiger formicilis]
MNMKNLSVRRLVRCAVIAAVYVVVCLVLAPFSYGAVQVRVAEALCLLPVFGAEYIVGVTLGCFWQICSAPPSLTWCSARWRPCWPAL